MKIEIKKSEIALTSFSELAVGVVFEVFGKYYLKTQMVKGEYAAVCLCENRIGYFSGNENVKIVKAHLVVEA